MKEEEWEEDGDWDWGQAEDHEEERPTTTSDEIHGQQVECKGKGGSTETCWEGRGSRGGYYSWYAHQKTHGQYKEWNHKGSGKYPTKSKHGSRKPPWAYQQWKRQQFEAGVKGNCGKTDSYGGTYTMEGYQDWSGATWEYLDFI